jgi:hypothetical protein
MNNEISIQVENTTDEKTEVRREGECVELGQVSKDTQGFWGNFAEAGVYRSILP